MSPPTGKTTRTKCWPRFRRNRCSKVPRPDLRRGPPIVHSPSSKRAVSASATVSGTRSFGGAPAIDFEFDGLSLDQGSPAVQPGARLPVPTLAALAAASVILIAVYPGFMSYDSVYFLHEARTAVQGGDYPPFVSYVWRVLDAIWPGPALMLFAQNFLLVLGFATILRTLRYSGPSIVAGVALFCVAPPLLGPMLVVWKDVDVSACLCAAVACFLVADGAPKPRLAIVAGIVLLFAGAAYRLNAISAVVPLVAWYSWRRGFIGLPRRRASTIGVSTFAGIVLAVVVVNGYRFPDLERLPSPGGLKNVMVHDLVAMSALTGKSLVPETTPPSITDDQIEYYRRIYDPRHVNLVMANDREGRIEKFFHVKDSVVYSAFLAAIREEPEAYAR